MIQKQIEPWTPRAKEELPDNFPPPNKLHDSDLLQLEQTPRWFGMSKRTNDYLNEAHEEFNKRSIKLRFILSAKPEEIENRKIEGKR